jgi:hypothetical protein
MTSVELLVSEILDEISNHEINEKDSMKNVLQSFNDLSDGHNLKMIAWDRQ